jgi:hypothetical protein
VLTVVAVAFTISGGESNWLSGWALIVAYAIVAAGFFYHSPMSEGEVSAAAVANSTLLMLQGAARHAAAGL